MCARVCVYFVDVCLVVCMCVLLCTFGNVCDFCVFTFFQCVVACMYVFNYSMYVFCMCVFLFFMFVFCVFLMKKCRQVCVARMFIMHVIVCIKMVDRLMRR